MNEEMTHGDFQLWRDFKWDEFLESESPKHPIGKEREEFCKAVELVREFSKVSSTSKPPKDSIREVLRLANTADKEVLISSLMVATQFANVNYKIRREENQNNAFAIKAVSSVSKAYKEKRFDDIPKIIRRFALEYGS